MDVTINIPETHLFEADGLAALRAPRRGGHAGLSGAMARR